MLPQLVDYSLILKFKTKNVLAYWMQLHPVPHRKCGAFVHTISDPCKPFGLHAEANTAVPKRIINRFLEDRYDQSKQNLFFQAQNAVNRGSWYSIALFPEAYACTILPSLTSTAAT